jgi:hypothetical protein
VNQSDARERRWKVDQRVRVKGVALRASRRVRSANARKDSQSAEALGRGKYVRDGHARWGDSEFENDGEEEKMRGIPSLGDVAVLPVRAKLWRERDDLVRDQEPGMTSTADWDTWQRGRSGGR